MKSYKDLIVWQKSMQLCELIYLHTRSFPHSEQYGLTSQIRRACIAVPSNIAEGYIRGHKNEYIQFLRIAYSSGAELETQLLIALRINYLSEKNFLRLNLLLTEVMKMLNVLINKLSSNV